MINKNYAHEIRTCQRIKFDQALYILTMYQKKIRKNRQNIYKKAVNFDKGVDADQQIDDITYAWKNKWKMDLTKPVLNCVTSVYPRILIDYSNIKNQKLSNFYYTLGKFIKRMRVQHQDQTNYKFVLNMYDKTTMIQSQTQKQITQKQIQTQRKENIYGQEQQKSQKQKLKMLNCSKAAVNSILNIAYNTFNNFIKHFQQNFQYIVNQDISDVDTEGLQWQVIRPLRFIREISRRAICNQQQQQMQDQLKLTQGKIQPVSQEAEQFVIFVHNAIKIMQKIKESEHGTTLITIQPQIKQLTYVIHPLLAAVYATFKKQNLQKQKDFNWKQSVPVQTKQFMQNVKNSYNFSKIVLINLDGYQSQFNLELARNFKKHLMYISFPKQQAILTDLQKIYSKRFFKKLMFKYTQASFQSYPTQNLSEDMKNLAKLQELNFNPENYHYYTQRTYNQHPEKAQQDLNQNVYVFPIRCKALKQNFPQNFLQAEKEDIEIYQSYFVKFIMKDFLINQIRQFNPSYVMISYSGRITIEDSHFVELIQELTKVANYKLIFYPNLTSAFCSEEMMQTQDKDGNQCDYDNSIYDKKIQSFLNTTHKIDQKQNEMEQQIQEQRRQQQNSTSILQLFNKIARFLKVSSGTYNLTKSNQQDTLISKFKNQFILAYTDQLMTTLGKQYNSIDRIRFKNKDLTIIPKLFQQNLNAIKKAFNKTVPQFYVDLYKILQILLIHKQNINNQNQQVLSSYKVNFKQYQNDILDLWEQLTKSSSIEISNFEKSQQGSPFLSYSPHLNSPNHHQHIRDQGQQNKNQKKDLIEQIQQIKRKKNRQKFISLKQLHFIEISSQKFQEKMNIYIKKNPELKQFTTISEESQETQGLYDVTFLRKDKSQIKIFQSTKVLYKNDQQNRQTNNVPILIMNNLSDQKPVFFQNYITELDINEEINKQRKNIEEKKTLCIPIVFKEDQNTVQSNAKTFIIKSDWNYQQTTNYNILFWPTQFDFLKAVIYKMLNKNYSPRLLNDIYIASKSSQKHLFRKVNTASQTVILPRMGCSSYEFQNRLFIFGGFYDKQKNYLNFQHDITLFDIGTYAESNGQKMHIQNIKGALYSQQNFSIQVQQRRKYNSFIRPKMEFQIFNKSQLADWYEQNNQTKDIILFGGYGQNFIRPFSMLTYYYYQIKLSRQTRNIISIEKKIIYDKTIPINVRQMTKNMGIIKTNKKNPNTNVLQTNKLTQPNSYLTFRNSFKIQKNVDNVEDFKYKFRYMYAEDEYKNYKNQIKKVQEQRTQQFDSSTISVQKMQGNNHLISLQKDGKKCVISLHLQIPHQKAKKLGCSRQVKLTHQSIVYIDFWNSMICAIIKHDFYTKGKSVLVQYNIKSLQNLSFNQDEIPHIALTWIKQFELNLSMHILIACNKNTIAILHGQKLANTQKVKQFIVKKKKNKTQAIAYEIQQRNILDLSSQGLSYCYVVFFKQRNKILCIQYLSDHKNSIIIEIAHQIQLNSTNDVYFWQTPSEILRQIEKGSVINNGKNGSICFYRLVLSKYNIQIPLHKVQIKQYLKIQKQQQSEQFKIKKPVQRVIQVQYNKKNYYIELGSLILGQRQNNAQILQLIPADDLKIQKQNIQRGTLLNKKLEEYYEIM